MESIALLIAATLNAGTVLAIAGLGLLINERAGIVNQGAEGMMLVAAVAGFATAVATGNEVAEAGLAAAREERTRARAEGAALQAQLANLRLVAPVDGVVTLREVEPGTTVVAGQAVVEVVDPATLWVDLRLDQVNAGGLAAGLSALVVLRSRSGEALAGRVLRVEPKADAVTEELLAKVVFDRLPEPMPPLGELAQVTLALPPLHAAAVIPNAALRREAGAVGVWRRAGEGGLRFVPLKLGASDLDGRVLVREGLAAGDEIVVYSEAGLRAGRRTEVVAALDGAGK